MDERSKPGPIAGGLAAVCLWGLAPVATRAAVGYLAPMPLLVIRLTVAALVLLPWAPSPGSFASPASTPGKRRDSSTPRRLVRTAAIAGRPPERWRAGWRFH